MAQKEKIEPCKLYLLTPPVIEPKSFAEQLTRTIGTAPDIVGAVQLRLKDIETGDFIRAAETLAPVCNAFDIPLIINDRPDVAYESGADGVHLGQDDASYGNARELLGDDALIGITCHASRHLAMIAGEQGANYVAFGAFFPTDSKETEHHADPDILAWCSEVTILPSVAIGGITPDNCEPLVAAGADYLAVIGSVWNHPDGPEAGIRAFAEILEE